MSAREYARLVSRAHRARKTPVIDRPMRPKMVAWAGPAAFYPNRFYEIDKWYKGRIDKPEQYPKLHIIDPTNHLHSLSFLENPQPEPINIGFEQRSKPVSVLKTEEERAVLERKARRMECDLPLPLTTISFQVRIESVKPGEYNTLFMVNLDGNPYEKEGEVVHWIVANIPDGKGVEDGEELVPYLQPLPFNGSGYHRVALLLFRHENPDSLAGRVLSMPKLYKQHEDVITPSSVSFFQTTYDISVKSKLHAMGLKSPIYEYQYNEALKPEQKEFPKKPQPFDLYMDMYRDPKEVEKELLEERLQRAQLDDYQAPKWLDPHYNENKRELPAWQHRRILARDGRYRALYNNALKS
ncbi:unnamed protein product [Heligmosomoides polygyrus]|uniref:Large ribosomal subunit protein mL38 n=1 Tax=Heligmosomoides polygyrus TaxID=6339 RepID=A0A183FDZ4_HELPZ|nr:unnamed protein product [Heligmosomoides polygyrus]